MVRFGLKSDILSSIYDADEFQWILKRERDRCDRNDNSFSLLAIDIQALSLPNLELLIVILQKRVRMIDEVGWFDNGHIGILLPDTNVNGSHRFLEHIDEQFMSSVINTSSEHVRYELYSYPSSLSFPIHDDEKVLKIKPFTEKLSYGFNIPVWKRALDIFVSVFGLLLLSPLLILVSVIISIVSPGPIIFKQERVGRGGSIFRFLKFRTMGSNNDESIHQMHAKHFINDAETEKPMLKLDETDTRIIPFGKFLRKSCIDELPQLLNVLRGDMSIVGPRPCIPYEAMEYLRWHARRFDITPGMTGLWQVSGKNELTFKEMIRLDIKYTNERSLWLDLKIILKTPMIILAQLLKNKINIPQGRELHTEEASV